MDKKTAKEILEVVEESGISVDNFGYGEWSEMDMEIPEGLGEAEAKAKDEFHKTVKENFDGLSFKERREHPDFIKWQSMPSSWAVKDEYRMSKLGLGKIVEIEQVGGEDQGSHWHSVKHFVDHDVYIMTTGHYTSYNGTDFYDGYGQEVFPAEKTVKYFATSK